MTFGYFVEAIFIISELECSSLVTSGLQMYNDQEADNRHKVCPKQQRLRYSKIHFQIQAIIEICKILHAG